MTAAGLIAGDDGRRYGLTGLRSSAPQAEDAVDSRVDARPDLSVDSPKDINSAPDLDLIPNILIPDILRVPAASLPVQTRSDRTNVHLSPRARVGPGDSRLDGIMILFAVDIFLGRIPILGQIGSPVSASGAIPLTLAEAYSAAIAVGVVFGPICLVASVWVFFAIMVQRGDRAASRSGPPPIPMKP